MEYIYIIGLIAFYLFRAFKSKDDSDELPAPTSTQGKPKRKSFEEMLEDLLGEGNDYTPPVPKSVPIDIHPPVRKPLVERKAPKAQPAYELPKDSPILQTELVEEGGRVTLDILEENVERPKTRRGFAGMNMTAREAMKAQIILERKF